MQIISSQARTWALAAAASIVFGAAASAATISADQRNVTSSGNVGSLTSIQSWSHQEMPGAGVLAFYSTVDESRSAGTNSAHSIAILDSSIGSTLMTGSGSASAEVTMNEESRYYYSSADASSRFSVTFTIVQPTLFNLTGDLAYDSITGSPCCGGAWLNLRNSNYSGPTFNLSLGSSSSSSDFTQSILLSGQLDPNTYTLDVVASAGADGYSIGTHQSASAMFDFEFTLGAPPSAVPLPATSWLLLTGVAGVAGRALRRRAA